MPAPRSRGQRASSDPPAERPPPQRKFRVVGAVALLLSLLVEVSSDPEVPASSPRPAGMEDLARRALAPWAGGIASAHFARAEKHVAGDCARRPLAWPLCQPFPTLERIVVRNGSSVEGGGLLGDYIRRALNSHPQMRPTAQRLVLYVPQGSDWPEFPIRENRGVPSLAPQNNGGFYDILFPTHTRGQFDDAFPALSAKLLAAGAAVPWDQRADKAVWRGAVGCAVGCGERGDLYFPHNHLPPSSQCRDSKRGWDANAAGRNWGCEVGAGGQWRDHERIRLVEYALAAPAVCGSGLDARFTTLNEHKDFIESRVGAGVVASWMGERVPEEDLAKSRFAVHVGNNGFADRLWRLMALGLTVFKVDNGWKEFYYDLLVPWEHYIPVNASLSDLCERLAWARTHPDEAKRIGGNAATFIKERLTLSQVDLYVAHLLLGYDNLTAPASRGGSERGNFEEDPLSEDWGPLGVPPLYQVMGLALLAMLASLLLLRRLLRARPCRGSQLFSQLSTNKATSENTRDL